jgi:peptidoglycan/LPS O-acetylase OafA/YrhL
MVPMIVAGAIGLFGLLVTFAGVRVRARIVGLSIMGAAAVTMLAVAGPADASTWWTVLLTAVTLAGMMAFAAVLSRRLDTNTDREVDREPGRGADRAQDPGIDEGRR